MHDNARRAIISHVKSIVNAHELEVKKYHSVLGELLIEGTGLMFLLEEDFEDDMVSRHGVSMGTIEDKVRVKDNEGIAYLVPIEHITSVG